MRNETQRANNLHVEFHFIQPSLHHLIRVKNPNKLLQLTAGLLGFNNVFGVVVGFGLLDAFRQTPAATELGSLGDRRMNMSP